MSHTNSTSNYSLPQFVGSDTPAWLTDVNGAMSTIDTQMKANADSASTAGTNATTANTNIGTLSNLNTTSKTNIVSAVNEVNTNLNTVSGVATGASTNAISAKNKADGIEAYLNLTQINALANPTTSNVTLAWQNVYQAVNADGTFGKLYGAFVATPTATSNSYVEFQTAFRPSETLTMNALYLKQVNTFEPNANYNKTVFVGDLTMYTDGKVRIAFASQEYNTEYRIILLPCVIFAKAFADIGGGNQ